MVKNGLKLLKWVISFVCVKFVNGVIAVAEVFLVTGVFSDIRIGAFE